MTECTPTEQPDEPFDYERSIGRLEEIVSVLESHDTGLEDALRLYEEGVTIARACMQRLRQAELRITELKLDDADSED